MTNFSAFSSVFFFVLTPSPRPIYYFALSLFVFFMVFFLFLSFLIVSHSRFSMYSYPVFGLVLLLYLTPSSPTTPHLPIHLTPSSPSISPPLPLFFLLLPSIFPLPSPSPYLFLLVKILNSLNVARSGVRRAARQDVEPHTNCPFWLGGLTKMLFG